MFFHHVYLSTQPQFSAATKQNHKQKQHEGTVGCEPHVPKLEVSKQCDNKLTRKTTSPKKVVVDTSSRVKFAITSSVATSVPIKQYESKKSHPRSLSPSKKYYSKRIVTKIPHDLPSERNISIPQIDNVDADTTVCIHPFSSNENNLTICSSSSLSKTLNTPEQSSTNIMVNSSMITEPIKFANCKTRESILTKTIDEHCTDPDGHLSIASTGGALKLQVDMRFGTEEYKSSTERLPDDNNTHLYSTSRSHSNVSCESFAKADESSGYLLNYTDLNSFKEDTCSQLDYSVDNSSDLVFIDRLYDVSRKESLQPSPENHSDVDVPNSQTSSFVETYTDKSSSSVFAKEAFFSVAGSLSGFKQSDSFPIAQSPSSVSKISRELSLSTPSNANCTHSGFELVDHFQQDAPTSKFVAADECNNISKTNKVKRNAATLSNSQLTISSVTLSDNEEINEDNTVKSVVNDFDEVHTISSDSKTHVHVSHERFTYYCTCIRL